MQGDSYTLDGRTHSPDGGVRHLLRDLGYEAVRDENGHVWFRELPESKRTPTRTLLDRSFTPGGPTIRENVDHIGRGKRAAA